MSFLLCYLYCFLIKALCEKMFLQDLILCVLEHMGERLCRICRNVTGNVMMFQGVEK